MTDSTKYSPTDLILASSATAFTGLSVVFAEVNFFSTVLEVITFAQEVFNARKKYPDNSLIQALTGAFDASIKQKNVSDSATVSDDGTTVDVITPVQEQLEKQDPSSITDFTMDLLKNVFSGLNSKVSPEELQEFKQFLYGLAESIANAAGEGVFGTGEKVSKEEAQVLAKLKIVLGL